MLKYLSSSSSSPAASPKRKRPTSDEESEDRQSIPPQPATPNSPSTKLHSNWRDNWTQHFRWLERGTNASGAAVAICKVCRDDGIKKKGFSIGTTNLQYSAFSRHESHNPDHLAIIQRQLRAKKRQTIDVIIEDRVQELQQETNHVREAEMKTMHFLARHALPLHLFNDAVKLQVIINYFHKFHHDIVFFPSCIHTHVLMTLKMLFCNV